MKDYDELFEGFSGASSFEIVQRRRRRAKADGATSSSSGVGITTDLGVGITTDALNDVITG